MTSRIILGLALMFLISNPVSTQDITEHLEIKSSELKCLVETIHYEARGEQKLGKIAVANVVLNRVNSSKFPDSICGVVKQKTASVCQFSWQCVKIKTTRVSNDVYELAVGVLSGTRKDPTNGALFFHNKTIPAFKRKHTATIGNHIFYK